MSDSELLSLLMEGGERLLDPPADVDELIDLLDQVESCLSKVEQSPTNATLNSLEACRTALVSDKLLKHADLDVRLAVASCISEVTRITAPEAPYDDDLMKDIFRITVTAFEDLWDMSSRSYNKRVAMLETVAKVRSCVVMLDLECDDLILEMFQHFMKTIREQHPENVFSSMLTIMTLVLDESEEISPELLGCILRSLKKDDLDISPIARKLGARVISNCAVRIKPCLLRDVKLKKISLDDYNTIATSIYNDTEQVLEQNGFNTRAGAIESMSPKADDDKSAQGSENAAFEDPEVDQCTTKSPPSVVDNEQVEGGQAEKRKRGRKPKNLPTVDVSDSSPFDREKDAADVLERKDGVSKDNENISEIKSPVDEERPASPDHDKLDAALPTKSHEKSELSSQPAKQPISSERPRRGRPPKRKSLGTAETPQSDNGGTGSVKKPKISHLKDEIKPKESDITSHSNVKNDDSNASSEDTTIDAEISTKESTHVKEEIKRKKKSASAEKVASRESSMHKIDSRRKSSRASLLEPKKTPENSSQKKREADTRDGVALDETLVGSKIEVYWPEDDKFYRGKVDSFDPVKKKHKILYTDGDVELLLLGKERWKFVSGGRTTDKVQGVSKVGEPSKLPISKTKTNDSEKSRKMSSEVSKRNKLEGGTSAKSGEKLTSGDAEESRKKSKDKTLKEGVKREDDAVEPKFDAQKDKQEDKQETKDGFQKTGSRTKFGVGGFAVKTLGEVSKINNKPLSNIDASDNGESPTTPKALEDAVSNLKLGSSAKLTKDEKSPASKSASLEKADSGNAQDTDSDRKRGKKRTTTST